MNILHPKMTEIASFLQSGQASAKISLINPLGRFSRAKPFSKNTALTENKQKDFDVMKFYFYDKNYNPKCFEKSDNYKILSQELQRHRVCPNCKNKILKDNFFSCLLCRGEHSLTLC